MESRPSSDNFVGRTVIVAGGTGRLGRVICLALAKEGADVIVNDVNVTAVTELVAELTGAGLTVHGITMSAVEEKEIVSQALSNEVDFRAGFESNVLGPISLAKAAWPRRKAQKYGRVVNFTSDSMLGMPAGSTYTCSKGALFGLNKTLAIEGAPHGIKVSCVSPIAYRPVMKRHIKVFSDDVQHAFKTLYTPEACVPLILALASAKCEVNGQVFTAAGWAVGRNVWGVVEGQREMRTADECLSKINAIATKGSKPVFEPSSMVDFFEFQTAWILGKAYEY